MRIRTILAATALAGAATLTLAGSAFAVDRDCRDFASHADAQAAFDAVPGDPEGLDADGDGKACEDQFVDDLIGDSGDPGDDSGDSPATAGDSGDDGTGRDTGDQDADPGDTDDGDTDDGDTDDGTAPAGGVATGGGGTAAGAGAAAPLAAAGASALVIGVLAAAGRRSGRQRG